MTSTRRGFLGSLSGAAALAAQSDEARRTGRVRIKITDLRCAIIGRNPVVRIVTDQGISGYGQAESAKPYLKPMVLFYRDYLLGEDPTDVNQVMLKIRRMGAWRADRLGHRNRGTGALKARLTPGQEPERAYEAIRRADEAVIKQ